MTQALTKHSNAQQQRKKNKTKLTTTFQISIRYKQTDKLLVKKIYNDRVETMSTRHSHKTITQQQQ